MWRIILGTCRGALFFHRTSHLKNPVYIALFSASLKTGRCVKLPKRKHVDNATVLKSLTKISPPSPWERSSISASFDFYPHISQGENVLRRAKQNAKKTINYIKSTVPEVGEFSQHGWYADHKGGKECGKHGSPSRLPMMPEIDRLLNEKNLGDIAELYSEPLKDYSESDPEVVEKLFAFVAYHITLNDNRKSRSANLRMLNEMFSAAENPSCHMHFVFLRSMAICGEFDAAYKCHQNLSSSGCVPDLITINTLLNAGNNTRKSHEAMQKIITNMKSNGIVPDSQTVVGCIKCLAHSPEAEFVLQKWGQILTDLKSSRIVWDVSILDAMLDVSVLLSNTSEISRAIFTTWESVAQLVTDNRQANSKFFLNYVKAARNESDKSVFDKIGINVMRKTECFQPHSSFFVQYCEALLHFDTVYVSLPILLKISPFYMRLNKRIVSLILQGVKEAEFPDFLPLLFSEMEFYNLVESCLLMWLDTALHLIEHIKGDTAKQVINICLHLSHEVMNFKRGPLASEYLDKIRTIIKSVGSDSIFNEFLSDVEKRGLEFDPTL